MCVLVFNFSFMSGPLLQLGDGLEEEISSSGQLLEKNRAYSFVDIASVLELHQQSGRIGFNEGSNLTRMVWMDDGGKMAFPGQNGYPDIVVKRESDSYLILDHYGVLAASAESLTRVVLNTADGQSVGLDSEVDGGKVGDEKDAIANKMSSILRRYAFEEK